MREARPKRRRATAGGLLPALALAALAGACGSNGGRGDEDTADSHTDAGAGADADTDTGADAEAEDGADADGDGDADGDADDGGGPCVEPTAEEQAALDAAVHAFLTGADDTLLDNYDATFGHICFDAVARAIRGWPLTGDTPAGVVVEDTYVAPLLAGALRLAVYVPASAVIDGTARVPLIVWLHWAGGTGTIDSMLVRSAELLGAIIVAPTAPSTCDWSADEECASQVRGAIGYVKARYPVDHDRVYVTGFSMGGRGSFTNALAYPDEFAGVLPVAGSIGAIHGTLDPAVHEAYVPPHVENAFQLRTALITGLVDNEYLVAQNTAAAGAFADLGYDFRWIPLAGVGHALPAPEWEPAMSWIAEKVRDPYPREVIYNQAEFASSRYDDLFFNEVWKTNVFWVRIDARGDDTMPARVAGWLDGSAFVLETADVSSLTVLLADELVDLDAPVSIVVNGTALFDGPVARDPRFALAHARAREERSMVFASEVPIAVP